MPFVLAESFFANIGGTMTMVGDPPNLIIQAELRDSEGVDFLDFIVNLAPPILISFPFLFGLMYLQFREHFQVKVVLEAEKWSKEYNVTNRPRFQKVIMVLLTTMLLMFLSPVHGLDSAWIALIGAVVMILSSTPRELHKAMESIEWDTLIYLASLFVMIEVCSQLRLIAVIGEALQYMIASVEPSRQLAVALLLILWVSALVSSCLDNTAYTLTMIKVVQLLADDPTLKLPVHTKSLL